MFLINKIVPRFCFPIFVFFGRKGGQCTHLPLFFPTPPSSPRHFSSRLLVLQPLCPHRTFPPHNFLDLFLEKISCSLFTFDVLSTFFLTPPAEDFFFLSCLWRFEFSGYVFFMYGTWFLFSASWRDPKQKNSVDEALLCLALHATLYSMNIFQRVKQKHGSQKNVQRCTIEPQ